MANSLVQQLMAWGVLPPGGGPMLLSSPLWEAVLEVGGRVVDGRLVGLCASWAQSGAEKEQRVVDGHEPVANDFFGRVCDVGQIKVLSWRCLEDEVEHRRGPVVAGPGVVHTEESPGWDGETEFFEGFPLGGISWRFAWVHSAAWKFPVGLIGGLQHQDVVVAVDDKLRR